MFLNTKGKFLDSPNFRRSFFRLKAYSRPTQEFFFHPPLSRWFGWQTNWQTNRDICSIYFAWTML